MMKSFRLMALVVMLLAWTGLAFGQTDYFDSVKSARQVANCAKDTYVLLSHNPYNFGKSKSDEEIVFMAKMYRDADIVVLQEVSTGDAGAQAVGRLKMALNRTGAEWDSAHSDATGGDNTERYAYLWKTKRISIKEVDNKKVNLLTLFRDDMVRVPAIATFSLEGKLLEVISVHLAPTAKHPENEIEKFSSTKTGYFDKPNQVIVGDFNLSHKKLDDVLEGELKFQHQIEGKTSLKSKPDPKPRGYLSKEYDNIYTKGFLMPCQLGIVDFVPMFSDIKKAKEISDHLPVFMIFTVK